MESEFKLHPEVASEFAKQVDNYYFFLIAVSAFFILLISGIVFFFCLKYRRRTITDRPKEIHGNNLLELGWTLIPFVLAMIMFFWSAHLYFKYTQVPAGAMEILVTGKQWMWKIQHPDGTREINELHIPTGQPIKLTMTSEDVIHSFFIPVFRVKTDVVPGRYTEEWFTPNKTGKFNLFCAEYCGTDHSRMIGSVYIMSPTDYDEWLSQSGGVLNVGKMTPAAAGAKLFDKLGCLTCHGGNPGDLGPSLVGKFGSEEELEGGGTALVNEDYVRESILYPNKRITKGFQPVMTAFEGQVNETQIMQLIAYLKSIGQQTAGE